MFAIFVYGVQKLKEIIINHNVPIKISLRKKDFSVQFIAKFNWLYFRVTLF